MGDRFFETRHANLELLLRRPFVLPGIGHNGGPPLLDMSWSAWVWRRAVAKAWETPPREVALRRLRRAERLGLSYRDYTAALLDTGTHLSTALLPLHHLHDGHGFAPRLLAALPQFQGRLLVIADGVASGRVTAAQCRSLLAWLNRDCDGRVEAVLALPFDPARSDAQRAQVLRRLLQRHNAPRKECFWLGVTPAESVLAEAAGLGWFKPVAQWFEDASAAETTA